MIKGYQINFDRGGIDLEDTCFQREIGTNRDSFAEITLFYECANLSVPLNMAALYCHYYPNPLNWLEAHSFWNERRLRQYQLPIKVRLQKKLKDV